MMDRPLRFCMITTFYPPYNFGGDGVFVHRLSNALANRGFRVDVIHCQDAYNSIARGVPDRSYDDHPNVTVHGLKSRYGFLSPLATQQTGYPLFKSAEIRRVLDQGFDVIHYHNISLLGPKVLEYGRGLKLYTMHEYWLVCPTHVLFKFNRAACTKPHCLPCTLIYKRPPQWWRYFGLVQAATRHVDRFIAPSRFSESIHSRMGLNVPITHLPHFVPTPENNFILPAQRSNRDAAKPYFLFVGRLEKLKGLQAVIPIFRSYGKAQLWIAGKGGFEPELRRLAANCDQIRFLGHLSDGDLRQAYRHAVAVIVPSICFETFGQVIVEAFTHQTPALVRNVGALPELIEESGGGLLYDTDTELVATMELLLDNTERRRALGRRGYEAYLRNWTAETHVQRYLELVSRIIAERSARNET